MLLNFVPYTVCAVVEDTSPVMDYSFAQAWIPYSAVIPGVFTETGNHTGNFRCQIIAHSKADFGKIKDEFEKTVSYYNQTLIDINLNFMGQPDRRFKETKRFGPVDPDMKSMYTKDFIVLFIVLLVPAINLSGFTLSRMRKRQAEIGIRKAFGSTRKRLIIELLNENILYSVIGAVVGLGISIWAIYILKGQYSMTSNMYWGIDVSIEIPLFTLLNLTNFITAFLICLSMNLLSAMVPVMRVLSRPITESLKNE